MRAIFVEAASSSEKAADIPQCLAGKVPAHQEVAQVMPQHEVRSSSPAITVGESSAGTADIRRGRGEQFRKEEYTATRVKIKKKIQEISFINLYIYFVGLHEKFTFDSHR